MIINIRRSDNQVVDLDQKYDDRLFDNAEYPDGTITKNDRLAFHFRDLADGTIKKITPTEIELKDPAEFLKRLKGEWQTLVAQLVTDVQALPANNPAKAVLIDLLQVMRLMAKMIKFE